jgi:hypothetical protein
MTYNLNPCNACMDKYKTGGSNINDINNCCYETVATFKGVDSVMDVVGTPEAENCVQCIRSKMKSMGTTPCEFQLAPPPIFNQTPHHFPSLLYKTKNPKVALKHCVDMCQGNKLPLECAANCKTDFASVVEKYEDKTEVKRNNLHKNDKKDDDATYEDISKDNPIIFYSTFAIVSLILAYILTIFLRSLLSK